MKQGVVISTWSGGKDQFECLSNSLNIPTKYGLLVVINDGDNADWISHDFNGTTGAYKIPYDGFELGALKTALEITDWDEFILLQDTFEILDNDIFDIFFNNYPNQSVFYGPKKEMFLAKYRREVLEKIKIPTTPTKIESIIQEVEFVKVYEGVEPFVIFNTRFTDGGASNGKEYRWGRENLVLMDRYLIKRKGTWDLPRQMPQEYQDYINGKYSS